MSQEYHHILVGTDGSQQAKQAFKKAVAVAKRNNGKIYLVNVVEQQLAAFMGYSGLNQNIIDQETASGKEILAEYVTAAKNQGFTNLETLIAYGSAKEVLASELPKKYAIDLIMVGQSGLNAVERFMTGSVASHVIRQAPCDVLVVTEE